MELKFQVQTKIQKPVHEVFDAVYNPKKLSGYFTTGGASGPLDEGATVMWSFADFDGGTPFPVSVKQVIADKLIVLEWAAADHDADSDGKSPTPLAYNTRVEMHFEVWGRPPRLFGSPSQAGRRPRKDWRPRIITARAGCT